jgi:hypothetical protein
MTPVEPRSRTGFNLHVRAAEGLCGSSPCYAVDRSIAFAETPAAWTLVLLSSDGTTAFFFASQKTGHMGRSLRADLNWISRGR